MPATIEVYYDFRSPYAYFAWHRLRAADIAKGHRWLWRPVSIDVLLNLQAGREPFAAYVDPLSAPKRAHLIADVRRLAAYYGLPLRSPRPPRPSTVPALWLAGHLADRDRAAFNAAVFDALWQQQRNVGDPEVLENCLMLAGCAPQPLDPAFGDAARAEIARQTALAYARGVFGVPSFVVDNEVFFGCDRLHLLLWSIDRGRAS